MLSMTGDMDCDLLFELGQKKKNLIAYIDI